MLHYRLRPPPAFLSVKLSLINPFVCLAAQLPLQTLLKPNSKILQPGNYCRTCFGQSPGLLQIRKASAVMVGTGA